MSMMWFTKQSFTAEVGRPKNKSEAVWLKRFEAVRSQVQKASTLLKPLDGFDGDLHRDPGKVVLDAESPIVKGLIEEILPESKGLESVHGSVDFDPESGEVNSLSIDLDDTKVSYSKQARWLRSDLEHFSWEKKQPGFGVDDWEWFDRPELHNQRPDTVMGDAFPARKPSRESGLRVDMTLSERSQEVDFQTRNWNFGILIPG